MKLIIHLFVLFLLINLPACNKKHKYIYVEYVPEDLVAIAGKDNVHARKERVFFETSDTAAYIKAQEYYMISWTAYRYFYVFTDHIKTELYNDKGAIVATGLSSENKRKLDSFLRAKYRPDKTILQFIDTQTLQDLKVIDRSLAYVPNTSFVEIRCGLYINKIGELAVKSEDRSFFGRPKAAYITRVYGAALSDSLYGGLKEMRYVVDTSTFKALGSFYFKDKRYVYDFNPMMGGGTIAINRDIDVKTFRVLPGDYYGKDKQHCFYRGNIVEGADIKSFRVLEYGTYAIAYDKYNYYERGEKMSKNEIKEEKLDSIRLVTMKKW